MSKQKRTPNQKREFLLDVLPSPVSETYWTIYDITSYFPHWNCRERKNYMERVTHTIKGSNFTVFIIDWWDSLSDEMAGKLAREWFDGNTTYHRLD